MKLKNIFLALITLASLASAGNCFAAVGILDASKQTDIEITCPVGVINCDAYTTRAAEVDKFSIAGTQTFFLKLLSGILNFAAIIAVIMLVIAGIRFATAMGSDEALKSAKNHVIWTIAGLLVIMLALLIVRNITTSIYDTLGGKTAPVTKPTASAPAATPAAETPAKETPIAACLPPASIPESCYEGDIAGVQTSKSDCKVAGEVLQPICKMLGLSEELGSGCTVKTIQQKLSEAKAYEGLPDNCSQIDGKYGQCTQQAVIKYCDKVNAK